MYYGLYGGLGFFFGGVLISLPVAIILLKNPFTIMLEGKGMLAFNMDSTGIITPLIMRVRTPYLYGKVRGKKFSDVFNRNAVFSLGIPKKQVYPVINDIGRKVEETPDQIPKLGEKPPIIEDCDNYLHIRLNKQDYNSSKFGFLHYPVVIYNAQTQSLLTKDWFSDKENESYAEHIGLLLNRRVEDLTIITKDFARNVVDNLLKNKLKAGGGWIIWVILGVLFVVLIILFGPALLEKLQGGVVESAAGALNNVQTPI
jgi:hypothetical protein